MILPNPSILQLPDGDNIPALLLFLNEAASFYWKCQTALERLDGMTNEDAEALPNRDAIRAAALRGQELATARQLEARIRLLALSALPPKWNVWPERRTIPRLDLV